MSQNKPFLPWILCARNYIIDYSKVNYLSVHKVQLLEDHLNVCSMGNIKVTDISGTRKSDWDSVALESKSTVEFLCLGFSECMYVFVGTWTCVVCRWYSIWAWVRRNNLLVWFLPGITTLVFIFSLLQHTVVPPQLEMHQPVTVTSYIHRVVVKWLKI